MAALLLGVIIGSASTSSKTVAAKPGPTITATATATATQTETAIETQTATVSATVTAHPVNVIATRTRTATITYTPPPQPAINDGTYHVGVDIKAGEWRTAGGGGCYWERDRNLDGGVDSIINNDNINGSAIVDLNRGEYFTVSGGCDWRRSV